MQTTQFDALLDAAESGVSFDGLVVGRDERGYSFETPDSSRFGLSASEFREVAADDAAYVSNWYVWRRVVDDDPPQRYAFLRWVEHADDWSVRERYDALATGVTREWGQLLLRATLADHGRRRYEVRHVDDAATDATNLDSYGDPLEARGISLSDDRDRYRPLKTVPSLPGGWRFSDLEGDELVQTVETFYPATVANWHLEREGDLDVTHFEEMARRQSGIYDIVDELDAEAVDWVAESCCVDSQCLKRREWDFDAETPLGADGGDGVFPCREPCSLVVAASRKWTMLEREESRSYEFELTPSEKEQVEDLIEAVADGRIDDIREADVGDGANRYRARFLRAKRFDADGNLSGTPTDE
ncbi:MAG: DR2241 family protein [Halobacteriota archaeon]